MMRQAVFLDRDGVINDNSKIVNVNRPDQLILFEDAPAAIELLNRAGFLVFVATNQGGVGLGYMSEDQLAAIHRSMVERLERLGARIDDIAACIHAPHADCSCRKPKAGLLLSLQEKHDVDLTTSYMVGDRETDVEAGRAAGTKTVLIGTGPTSASYQARSILDAAKWIVEDAAR